jgi:excinuclease ABC subunit C
MEVVRRVIEDELGLNIPIAGLAKDGKHRTSELLYGFPQQTIGIDQRSPLFNFLTRIQDEVHRYAIAFHRDKRSKSLLASELDNIKGIGPTTKTELLKKFKSIKRIKEASEDEIAEIIGKAKTKLLIEGLKKESTTQKEE